MEGFTFMSLIRSKWVKIWAGIVVCCFSLAILSACTAVESSDDSDSTYLSSSSATDKEENRTKTVTLSKMFFEDSFTSQEMEAILNDKSYNELTLNGDGSRTISMPEETYNNLVAGLDAKLKSSLQEIADGDEYPGISSIEYDDRYSKIEMVSSVNPLSDGEQHASYSAGLMAIMFQKVSGQEPQCTIMIRDRAGQVIQEVNYPEDFDIETKASL